MPKLNLDQKVPAVYEKLAISEIVRAICNQVNSHAEGRMAALYAANSIAPSGSATPYAVGDIIWDNNPTVSATVAPGVGLNYVRLGWITNVAGSPGTQQEIRVLTGGGSISVPASFSITPNITYTNTVVALSNTGLYFDGPSQSVVAGAGVYFASGTVTIIDTAGAAAINLKLWDGTTVISSARKLVNNVATPETVALSGYITAPAGNIRISCQDVSSTSGQILFNSSGNSKDSSLTLLKIG